MFEAFVPTRKIGCLLPNTVIDNHPAEFYRLVPEGVMLVMVGVGLKEFSSGDVDRGIQAARCLSRPVNGARVDMVTQNGVPLPILMGVEKHDRMIRHMAEYYRKACNVDGFVCRAGGGGPWRAQGRDREQMDRGDERDAR